MTDKPTISDVAEPWKPPEPDEPNLATATAERWIGKEPPPLRFTITDLVPEGMVTLLAAEGGAGKTVLLQSALTALSAGVSFLGRETMSGAAAGLFAEDPEAVLHHRQRRIDDVLEVELEQFGKRLYIVSYFGRDATLWHDGQTTEFFRTLEQRLGCIPDLRLLALDNAALLFSGSENDRIEVTAFLNQLNGLAHRLGIGIVLSTHQSKSRADSTIGFASGSTAWVNASRSALEIRPADDNNPIQLILRKANHTVPGAVIDLAWENGVLTLPSTSHFLKSMEKRSIDKVLFNEIEAAWKRGLPLTLASQAKDRHLQSLLSSRYGYKAKDLEKRTQEWIATGDILPKQKIGPKDRDLDGLRVVKWPPHVPRET